MPNQTDNQHLSGAALAATRMQDRLRNSIVRLEQKQLDLLKFGLNLHKDLSRIFDGFDQRTLKAIKLAEALVSKWEDLNKMPLHGFEKSLSNMSAQSPYQSPENHHEEGAFGRSRAQLTSLLARTVRSGVRGL